MDPKEFQNIPEVQERQAAEGLARLYQNLSNGDVHLNMRAVSAVFTVKYLESLGTLGVDRHLASEAHQSGENIRRSYSGVPKILMDGIKYEGQEFKPNDTWVINQAQKLRTFSEAMEIVEAFPMAETLNLMIDTVLRVDLDKSRSRENVGRLLENAIPLAVSELKTTDLELVLKKIEGVMKMKEKDMEDLERPDEDEYNMSGSRDTEATVAFLVINCIDYAIETYPTRALKRLEGSLRTNLAKDVLRSMIDEFASAAYHTLHNVYYDEYSEFMDDIVNVLVQNDSLQMDDLIKIRTHIHRILEN